MTKALASAVLALLALTATAKAADVCCDLIVCCDDEPCCDD
jgi:hypothetical protein